MSKELFLYMLAIGAICFLISAVLSIPRKKKRIKPTYSSREFRDLDRSGYDISHGMVRSEDGKRVIPTSKDIGEFK